MIYNKQSETKKTRNIPQLLVLCIILSLGLHLIAVISLTNLQDTEKPQLTTQNTQIINLVDRIPKTKKTRKREFEIDQRQTQPEPLTPVESFRKADHDQKVDQERAPKGDDSRDRTTKKIISEPSKPLPRQTKKTKSQPTTSPSKKKSLSPTKKPVNSVIKKDQPTKPQLTLKDLTPSPEIINKIARGDYSNFNSNKERSNTETGDTVWLTLQNDRLVSFFLRFHNQIELVWNYPQQAAIKGIEGTLLLLITIDRKGNLIDVDIKESSGSEMLDFEAIQAVYRAAPFGPLSKYYPHDKLKIYAHFRYRLGGSIIYGR